MTDEVYFTDAGSVPGSRVEQWPLAIGARVRVKSGVFDGHVGVVLEDGPFGTVTLLLEKVEPSRRIMVLRADLEPEIDITPAA